MNGPYVGLLIDGDGEMAELAIIAQTRASGAEGSGRRRALFSPNAGAVMTDQGETRPCIAATEELRGRAYERVDTPRELVCRRHRAACEEIVSVPDLRVTIGHPGSDASGSDRRRLTGPGPRHRVVARSLREIPWTHHTPSARGLCFSDSGL